MSGKVILSDLSHILGMVSIIFKDQDSERRYEIKGDWLYTCSGHAYDKIIEEVFKQISKRYEDPEAIKKVLSSQDMDQKFGPDWKMRLMIQDLEDQKARK